MRCCKDTLLKMSLWFLFLPDVHLASTLLIIPLSLILECRELEMYCQKCCFNHVFNIIWKVVDWTQITSESIFSCSVFLWPFLTSFLSQLLYCCYFLMWIFFFLHVDIVSSWKEVKLPLTVRTYNRKEGHAPCLLQSEQREHIILKQTSIFILSTALTVAFTSVK